MFVSKGHNLLLKCVNNLKKTLTCNEQISVEHYQTFIIHVGVKLNWLRA